MFDFPGWIETFKEYFRQHGTAYNDAYGMISLDDPTNRIEVVESDTLLWRVLGIHHLAPEENQGNHNIYIEMLCKQGDREAFRAIHWTWQGRRSDENAPDVFAGQKPPNELVNIPLNLGMIVSVWPHLGETVKGFSSNHPDADGGGNTIGHHSFFVCFQEIDPDAPPPDPDPDPDPPTQGAVLLISKEWIDGQPVDGDGYIRVRGD